MFCTRLFVTLWQSLSSTVINMYGKMQQHLQKTLAEIKEAGLYKEERLIESPQQAAIQVGGKEVLNF